MHEGRDVHKGAIDLGVVDPRISSCVESDSRNIVCVFYFEDEATLLSPFEDESTVLNDNLHATGMRHTRECHYPCMKMVPERLLSV